MENSSKWLVVPEWVMMHVAACVVIVEDGEGDVSEAIREISSKN